MEKAKKLGILLSPDFPAISPEELENLFNFVKKKKRDILVLTKQDYLDYKKRKKEELREKEEISQIPLQKREVVIIRSRKEHLFSKEHEAEVKVLKSFKIKGKKRKFDDFLYMFLDRYEKAKKIFSGRLSPIQISLAKRLEGREVDVVGIVSKRREVKKGLIIELEDPTGTIRAFIPKENSKINYIIRDIALGVKGKIKRGTIFADEIFFPDIPTKQLKPLEDDVWACFIGDFHFGSRFLDKKLIKIFLDILKGRKGTSKIRELIAKTKYFIILGDIVDGVGIYPEQKKELEITDVFKQYELAANFLEEFPEDKFFIIIPGNHDAVPNLEPQPPLGNGFSKPLKEKIGDRAVFLSNPAYFYLNPSDGGGRLVLAYHGYSIDRIISEVPMFRGGKEYREAWKVLKYLLQVRHLAPKYGSTLQVPDKTDYLFINPIPDVLCTAHIHYLSVGIYKGVRLISTSCFQAPTPFQYMLGHNPKPGLLPFLHLRDGSMKIVQLV